MLIGIAANETVFPVRNSPRGSFVAPECRCTPRSQNDAINKKKKKKKIANRFSWSAARKKK